MKLYSNKGIYLDSVAKTIMSCQFLSIYGLSSAPYPGADLSQACTDLTGLYYKFY